MKCIITVLILCVMLVPICKAESSTERFLSNLSDTWDSFLDMAEDAGKDATKWAEGSGVTEWAKGKANDIAVWAKENGLTDWAQETLSDLTAWFDETEITGWASNTSQEFQVFIEENRPAIKPASQRQDRKCARLGIRLSMRISTRRKRWKLPTKQ